MMTALVNGLFTIGVFVGSAWCVMALLAVVAALVFGWKLFTFVDPALIRLYFWTQRRLYFPLLIAAYNHFAACCDHYGIRPTVSPRPRAPKRYAPDVPVGTRWLSQQNHRGFSDSHAAQAIENTGLNEPGSH